MARSVVVSLAPGRADSLVQDLSRFDGLVSLQRQHGASLQPPGDVVTILVTDRSIAALMRTLQRYGAGEDASVSVSMSEPTGVVTVPAAEAIEADVSSSSLEEMEFSLQREATMTLRKLIVMSIAGGFAAVGLATNALHLVIGGMLVAPGFEPILKISLGAVRRGHLWKRGLGDTLSAYGAMATAGAVTALILGGLGVGLPAGPGGYLEEATLVAYWTQLSWEASLVTAMAAAAGTLLVVTNRAVLTAGVMVALALVPAATLTGMGLVAGEPGLAGEAAVRLAHDAGVVLTVGALIFLLEGAARHRLPIPGGEHLQRSAGA